MMDKFCRGPNCKAKIEFLKNTKGRTVVVDARPVRVWVPVSEGDGALVAVSMGYTDHHVTCPDAELFKRPRKASEVPRG